MVSMWFKCKIQEKENVRSLPRSYPLPTCHSTKMPYVFLGDDAFALSKHTMKPFPQRDLTEEKRTYNYRHSRARRLSENLFGILANRWRVHFFFYHVSRSEISCFRTIYERVRLLLLIVHQFSLIKKRENSFLGHGDLRTYQIQCYH